MIGSHNALGLTLALAVCAASVILSGAALRHQDDIRPTAISVRSNDLDFDRPSDNMILFERIKEASVEACGGTPDFRDIRRVSLFEQCRKAAIRLAVLKADQPVLTEIADIDVKPMRLAVR
jgi:UrcA family protein